jgi:hypothetical protein
MVTNLLHAFSCLAAGVSPIGQPCIEYSNGIPFLSYSSSGGVIGSLAKITSLVTVSPPIRTGQYLATIGDSLGFVKDAHAQSIEGAGNGVLEPILNLWKLSRNISYIVMILLFIIIGLMVMFRQKINPQTVISVQAALPGLVIGLIMITFSYFLASFIVDTAYLGTDIVGYYFSAAQGNPKTDLVQKTSNQNLIGIMSNLMNGFGKEDMTSGAASFFNQLQDPALRMVRIGLALMAYQYGSAVGPAAGSLVAGGACAIGGTAATPVTGPLGAIVALGTPICAALGGLIGGIVTGGVAAAAVNIDPPAFIGVVLWVIALAAIIFTMLRLLLKLINNYLQIIFLTITAPFHFLIASMPGRQGIATDWIRNMLCNTLAFPAVMAVFYFVAYLLGPQPDRVNLPFVTSDQLSLTGGVALPLFGGLDLKFIRILLAFGAIVATPSIPDIICQAIGKVGRAGSIIDQQVQQAQRGGQGYVNQARGGAGKVAGNVQSSWQAYKGDYARPGLSGAVDKKLKGALPDWLKPY